MPITTIGAYGIKESASEATTSSVEEFALGIDPKTLHAVVLMQMVYNAVIWHSRGFLKHMAISVVKKVKIMVAQTEVITNAVTMV